MAFIFPIGSLLFLAAIVYCVSRYRREQPGPFSPLQGAKLGAFNGLVAFAVLTVLILSLGRDEFRRQMVDVLQKRYAGNPDPQLQQFLHWAATNQGFLVFTILMLLFLLALLLVISSFAGALTVTLSGNKNR
ncbi:MAG TPA: hypothetical protein VJA94_15675 [Candidatus Angelobacter sp.]